MGKVSEVKRREKEGLVGMDRRGWCDEELKRLGNYVVVKGGVSEEGGYVS